MKTLVLCFITILSLFLSSGAFAFPSDIPNPKPWVTDGTVYAIATRGATTYIGGAFHYAGPNTGYGVSVDVATGSSILPYSRINGHVYAVLPDGSGGWYIGGNFTGVGGVERNGLAHILSSGALDLNWDPKVNVTVVRALAISGGTIYAGGTFTKTIPPQTWKNLAAINVSTGEVITSWTPPDINGSVHALSVGIGAVYAGGGFTDIGGQARNRLSAFNDTDGALTAWHPGGTGANNLVHALAVSGDTVYAGGDFVLIGGQDRGGIAAIGASTGDVTSWVPSGAVGNAFALSVSGGTVYAGSFGAVSAIDAITGNVTWNHNTNNAWVNALAVTFTPGGRLVFAGGTFGTTNNQATSYFANINGETGVGTFIYPAANGSIHALAVSGGTVYAGGQFTSYGVQTRYRLAAIDSLTGVATPWDPNSGGSFFDGEVRALLVSGGTVYAGGSFTSITSTNPINVHARNRLAAFDALTGEITPWDPDADGLVYTLAESGGIIYAGGEFTNIGVTPRNRLAAIEVTGALNPWNPNLDFTNPLFGPPAVNTIVVSGATIYIGGSFTHVGPTSRNGLAAFDASNGSLTTWDPNADGAVTALAVSGNTVYAGGRFLHIGNASRHGLAAMNVLDGAPTDFSTSTPGGVPFALAVSNGILYVGGSFTQILSNVRYGIAAFDITGVLPIFTIWNPNSVLGYGGATIYALSATAGRVYAGGSFNAIGKYSQSGIAEFGTIFTDVPLNYWAYDYIMTIFYGGVTLGCGSGGYCPGNNVTREQMAAFIVRAKEGGLFFEGQCTGQSPFDDVPSTSPFCRNIERLVALQITAGCVENTYCPTNNVTREQMAAFIVRAKEGGLFFEGQCTGQSPFDDVPSTSPFCRNIERLVALGVTQGCAQGMYCPADNVLRDQMAAFLARAFLGMP